MNRSPETIVRSDRDRLEDFFQVMTGFGAPKTRQVKVTFWPSATFTTARGESVKEGSSANSKTSIPKLLQNYLQH